MHGSDTIDLNFKTLRRIVALLLALAGLAERAALRSPALRASVLWLLRPGEVFARDYVAALTGRGHPVPPFAYLPTPADGAADALRLAGAFRTLAAMLIAFVEDSLAAFQATLELTRNDSVAPRAAGLPGAYSRPASPVERRDSS